MKPLPTVDARTVRRALALLAAACVLAAVTKLRPLWQDFETVRIRLDYPARAQFSQAEEHGEEDAATSPGERLDAVLLRNLTHLGYLRSFDHVFARGRRSVTITRPLWLDRCEVRQGDFYKFAGWRPFHPDMPIAASAQPADWRHFSNTRGHTVSGRLDAPANGLTWFDAYAYCQAAGGRLPRATEWIAAASGREQRLYPWGDVFNAEPWPYLDPLLNAARKCGAHPDTDTPSGLADMGQHVSEWAVADDRGHTAAAMGGNAYNAPRDLYSVAILYRHAPARYRSPYLGFRCAFDAPPQPTPWRTEPNAVVLSAGDYAVGIPEHARIPSLLTNLPRGRVALIRRLFEREDGRASVDVHLTAREITRREYAAFLRDPFVIAGFHAEANQPREHSHRPPDWDKQMTQPELPVVNVDWWSAYAFASWAGGRLPSAEEWEAAASGQGRRIYPWGNDFAAAAPNTAERTPAAGVQRGPIAASAADGDATPEGLLAMGGNVSEWTRSVSGASGGYAVIVKGGNYLLPGTETARMDYRNHLSPNYRSRTLGFRVAFDRPR